MEMEYWKVKLTHPPGFMVLPFGPCVFVSGEKEGTLGEGEREGTFPWFCHSLSYSPHHCDSLLKTPALKFCLSVFVCWPPPPYHCFLNHNSWFTEWWFFSNELGCLSIGQCFLEMSTLVILITSVHRQLGSVTHVFTLSEMFLIVIIVIVFIIISFL